jgi:hypothetical protein
MQTWVRDSQKASLNIDGGTEETRWWEEKLRGFYKMCRETCRI